MREVPLYLALSHAGWHPLDVTYNPFETMIEMLHSLHMESLHLKAQFAHPGSVHPLAAPSARVEDVEFRLGGGEGGRFRVWGGPLGITL